MGIRSTVATITLTTVLSFACFTAYVEGCGSGDGTNNQSSKDEQAIGNLFAAIKSRAEAHDVDGFIALVAPDYLHNCKDASQFRTKLSEVLPTVRTLTFNIITISVNESQATVSAVITITSTAGGAVTAWTEPDTTDNSLGLGYLIKSNGQWLIVGDQLRAKPMVQVAYLPDSTSGTQYYLGFYITSSCAAFKGTEVNGPNISTTTLNKDTRWGGLSSLLVPPSHLPTVGDQYTFSITYDDNSHDTLYDSVKAIIGVALSIDVTFPQGTTQITWSDVSKQVPNAASYLVEVTSQNGTSIWNSPYSLDRTSAIFDEDHTATQTLQSKQKYYFSVMLFDIYENYTSRNQLVTIP